MKQKKTGRGQGASPPGQRRSRGKERVLVRPGSFRVESLSSVRDFLRQCPEKVIKICSSPSALARVEGALRGLKRPEIEVSDKQQELPFWAEVRLDPVSEKQFFTSLLVEQNPVILALDHMTDPGNLGAVSRTAAFFGIRHILVPKNRQVCYSHAAVNTSQGGFAWTELVQVTNLARCLNSLKKQGYWIVGCEKGGEGPEESGKRFERVVLVLGGEEKGLSHLVRELCDIFVGIVGIPEGLDSLNVSVAAGIIIRAVVKEQKIRKEGFSG